LFFQKYQFIPYLLKKLIKIAAIFFEQQRMYLGILQLQVDTGGLPYKIRHSIIRLLV